MKRASSGHNRKTGKAQIREPHPFSRFEKKKSARNRTEPETDRPFSKQNRFSGKKSAVSYRKKEHTNLQEQHPFTPASTPFPLNKYLAHCGVCARRKAIDHIKAGEVTVNNKKILEPGFKVTAKDKVTFRKRPIHLQQKTVYLLLNKPKDYLTTTHDPRGRRTIMDLIRHATTERVYPVGRLDRNTSGLLLITNDGALAQQLSHPGSEVKKVYHVTLDKPLQKKDFDQILSGVELEDGLMAADALAFVETQDNKQLGLEIHSGRNRIVRRLFAHLGYEVKQLDRVLYAGLTKKNLPRGKWRYLSEKEIRTLKHFTPGKKKSGPVQ